MIIAEKKEKKRQYNTLRKRKLIKAIPKCKTLREASTIAGYTPNSRTPYTKQTKAYISNSLEALGYSKDAIQSEIERYRKLLESKGDYKACIDSLMHNAKLAGHLIDKLEAKGMNQNISVLQSMSAEQLEKHINELKGQRSKGLG